MYEVLYIGASTYNLSVNSVLEYIYVHVHFWFQIVTQVLHVINLLQVFKCRYITYSTAFIFNILEVPCCLL